MHGALWDRQRNSRFVSKKKKKEKKRIGSNTRVQRELNLVASLLVQAPYLISKETTTGLIPSRSFLFHAFSFVFPRKRSSRLLSVETSFRFSDRPIFELWSFEEDRRKKTDRVFKKRWRGIWFSRRIVFLYRRSVLSTRSRFIYVLIRVRVRVGNFFFYFSRFCPKCLGQV